jgi:hypothetical protein
LYLHSSKRDYVCTYIAAREVTFVPLTNIDRRVLTFSGTRKCRKYYIVTAAKTQVLSPSITP